MIHVRDPIYKSIEVEDEFIRLVDNPFFQRLRNIKQNSLLYFVYPSAKHDRFSHSLGVYHLMKLVVENSYNQHLSDKDKFHLKAAALLHDIGHGPYSHLWEQLIPSFDHEEMSSKIIREKFGLGVVADIIEKKHSLHPFLSSVIDVDKLDYLARDSYFCGVGYGQTDVERILKNMRIEDGKIVVDPKLVSSVEHMITGRISLFKSTYYHHRVQSMDILLEKIFSRVRYLVENNNLMYCDDILLSFIEDRGNLQDFVRLDDTVIKWHLLKWQEEKDNILADLVERFLERKGFKGLDPRVYKVTGKELQQRIAKDYDVEYYFYEKNLEKTPYEKEMYVKKKDGSLMKLSEFSAYIHNVISLPIQVHYLIGPDEIIDEIKYKSMN